MIYRLFTFKFYCVKILNSYFKKAFVLKPQKWGRCMNSKLKTPSVEQLFEAVLSLENKDECFDFFEDVCTINELLSLAQRFEVAKMLREHKTYLDIAEKTGASTATISRVNRSLNYGNDGYDRVFKRLNMLEETSSF